MNTSRAKKKTRKAKRSDAGLRRAAASVHDAETPLVEVTRSAEAFIASPDDATLGAGGADDMAEYLGEIFVDGGGHRNDVALDMETLQPVVPPSAQTPTISLGPSVSEGQVRDLVAEFEDAPTLPEAPYYRGTDLSAGPDVHVAARFADFDDIQAPRIRINGR
jgi:hypothetical protein